MSLLGKFGARRFRAVLTETRFTDWYRTVSGTMYATDPWAAFDAARSRRSTAKGRLRLIVDLFVMGYRTPSAAASEEFGAEVIEEWRRSGLVIEAAGSLTSRYCLLSAFGKYLLLEFPSANAEGRFIPSGTYLSKGSYECALATMRSKVRGRFLELGCGSGLSSVIAAETARHVVATDIDQGALEVARANLNLNNCTSDLMRGDMCEALAPPTGFDFILLNPPWRIVPEQVAYPNPRARVGWGRDGLDAVRLFLRDAPKIAAAEGTSVIRVDFPGTRHGFSFERELAEFVADTGQSVVVNLSEPVDVGDQCMISAQTCVHLNSPASVTELADRFADNYRRLGIDTLYPSLCELKNDRAHKLEIKSDRVALIPQLAELSESHNRSSAFDEVLG